MYDVVTTLAYQPCESTYSPEVPFTAHRQVDTVEILLPSAGRKRTGWLTCNSRLMPSLLQAPGEIQRLLFATAPRSFSVYVQYAHVRIISRFHTARLGTISFRSTTSIGYPAVQLQR